MLVGGEGGEEKRAHSERPIKARQNPTTKTPKKTRSVPARTKTKSRNASMEEAWFSHSSMIKTSLSSCSQLGYSQRARSTIISVRMTVRTPNLRW